MQERARTLWMRTMIAAHDISALRSLARQHKVAVSELRTAEKRLFKHRVPVDEVLAALPEAARAAWRALQSRTRSGPTTGSRAGRR